MLAMTKIVTHGYLGQQNDDGFMFLFFPTLLQKYPTINMYHLGNLQKRYKLQKGEGKKERRERHTHRDRE